MLRCSPPTCSSTVSCLIVWAGSSAKHAVGCKKAKDPADALYNHHPSPSRGHALPGPIAGISDSPNPLGRNHPPKRSSSNVGRLPRPLHRIPPTRGWNTFAVAVSRGAYPKGTPVAPALLPCTLQCPLCLPSGRQSAPPRMSLPDSKSTARWQPAHGLQPLLPRNRTLPLLSLPSNRKFHAWNVIFRRPLPPAINLCALLWNPIWRLPVRSSRLANRRESIVKQSHCQTPGCCRSQSCCSGKTRHQRNLDLANAALDQAHEAEHNTRIEAQRLRTAIADPEPAPSAPISADVLRQIYAVLQQAGMQPPLLASVASLLGHTTPCCSPQASLSCCPSSWRELSLPAFGISVGCCSSSQSIGAQTSRPSGMLACQTSSPGTLWRGRLCLHLCQFLCGKGFSHLPSSAKAGTRGCPPLFRALLLFRPLCPVRRRPLRLFPWQLVCAPSS